MLLLFVEMWENRRSRMDAGSMWASDGRSAHSQDLFVTHRARSHPRLGNQSSASRVGTRRSPGLWLHFLGTVGQGCVAEGHPAGGFWCLLTGCLSKVPWPLLWSLLATVAQERPQWVPHLNSRLLRSLHRKGLT